MILWTMQAEQVWEELQSTGVFGYNRQWIEDEDHIRSYEWLRAQMIRRIGPPPKPDAYPVWAWRQRHSAKRPKPDLRRWENRTKGDHGVRIEFECPEQTVLLSDYVLWHHVLNYFYLPKSKLDADLFDAQLKAHGLFDSSAKPLPDPELHNKIVNSWERIFDLGWYDKYVTLSLRDKAIQATVWAIKIDQVRDHNFYDFR